jgi:hypothetical protein
LINITLACSAGLLDVLVMSAPLKPADRSMSFNTPMENGVTASAFAFGPKCMSMSVAAAAPAAACGRMAPASPLLAPLVDFAAAVPDFLTLFPVAIGHSYVVSHVLE